MCIRDSLNGETNGDIPGLDFPQVVVAQRLGQGIERLDILHVDIEMCIRDRADMALGNVIGSNIANILLILGVSATINPLSMGGITVWGLLMVLLSSVVVFLAAFTFRRKAIDRWEGTIFVAIYVAYIWYLIR